MEGGNLRNALQELQQIIMTPIKTYSPPSVSQTAQDIPPSDSAKPGGDKENVLEGYQSHNPPPCDGDSSATPISDSDIPGQFTRVMGKGKIRFPCPQFPCVTLQLFFTNDKTSPKTSQNPRVTIYLLCACFIYLFSLSVHSASGVKAR